MINVRRAVGFLVGALALASSADAAWLEARTNTFVVMANMKDADIRDMATRLERFDQFLRKAHGLSPVAQPRSNPLTVYVLDNVGAVQQLCEAQSGCANAAGFYIGRAEGSAVFTPRRSGDDSVFDISAQAVLFHEYAHHFMLENWSAAYPAWFTEGFAEFYGASTFERDGAFKFGQVPNYRLYGLLTTKALPLAQMLAAEKRPKGGAEEEALYGRGWLLTHYLTFEPSRQGQLDSYLGAINQGLRGQAAAEKAFGELAVLEKELNAYIARKRLRYVGLPATAFAPVTVTVRELSPGEGAMMRVRIRSDRGVDRSAAERVVAEARPLAARFPADAGVQVVLAEAEYDAGNDDAAEAAADRALAVDPRFYGAMIYKGRARIRRLAARGGDDAAWNEARGWFIKANAIDNDAAGALMLFYESFVAERRKPTPNAIAALERAQGLVPQDAGLRWLLVKSLADRGSFAEARNILAPLAFDPHAAADNAFAALLAALDARDAATAQTAIAEVDRTRSGGNP